MGPHHCRAVIDRDAVPGRSALGCVLQGARGAGPVVEAKVHPSGGPHREAHPVPVRAYLRYLLRRCEPVGYHYRHQPGKGGVLVGDVHLIVAVQGDARIPAGTPIFVQGLNQPLGAIEPSVLQVPVGPVMVGDVRPVCAVYGDGDRCPDVVAALVVDCRLGPC